MNYKRGSRPDTVDFHERCDAASAKHPQTVLTIHESSYTGYIIKAEFCRGCELTIPELMACLTDFAGSKSVPTLSH